MNLQAVRQVIKTLGPLDPEFYVEDWAKKGSGGWRGRSSPGSFDCAARERASSFAQDDAKEPLTGRDELEVPGIGLEQVAAGAGGECEAED